MKSRLGYLLSRLLLIVMAVAAPLIALQAVSIEDARRDAERRAFDSMKVRASEVADRTSDVLKQAEHLMSFLAARRRIREMDLAACETLVEGVAGSRGMYTDIGLIDRRGRLVCASAASPPGTRFMDFPWFRDGLAADGFHLSDPIRGRVSGRMVMYLTLPVIGLAGDKAGVLAASIDLAPLNDRLRAVASPAGSAVSVVKDGRLFVTRHPEPERWMGQPVPTSLDSASPLAGAPVRVAVGADGVLRAFAQTSLQRYGLVAYAGMPAPDMYAQAHREALRRLAMALLAVALGLAAAWLAARQLAASLRSIADTARRLQEGRTNVRADPGLPGEFGEVAAEFNRLMDRNDERAAQLHRSEQHAVRLRRFYQTLSAIGGAIARQAGPQDLYAQACRACVDSGLAQAVWVVGPDEVMRWSVVAHCMAPEAHAAEPAGAADAWGARLAGVVRRAVDGSAPHMEALSGGQAQLLAVPIVIEGHAVAALVLGAVGDARFDDELLQLLDMLAAEVALGVSLAQHRDARAALLAAEAASQAKTSFLSHVSHELRTPLNAVLGFAQLLRAHADAAQDGEAQAHVAQVLAAGRQLKELIDDLMDVSRIEAGQLAIEMADAELVAKLRGVAELNRPLALRHGVTVVVQSEGPSALWLRTDPLRLHQVLMNLVSNAIKYNRPGGQVRLVVSRDAAQGGRAHIRVEDDGQGMSPAQLKRLFTAFDRLGRERSSIEGTGIGLFITHRLVDLLGGTVAVDSTEGVGTTVTVSLPLGALPAPRAQPAEPPSPAGGAGPPPAGDAGETSAGVVLYIEDNPVNAMLVEQCLAPYEVRVLIAPDGEDGLRQAAELRPHLVLLDMQLPDLHGLDVLARLRADPRTARLRVIALSASAMPAEVEAARHAGAQAYWTKPFEFGSFIAGVTQALREETAARRACSS